ncbi:TetR/AcrR family transcriptional regulator [Sphingomonas sp.]|uniref:TetR/AcrR family transcriptional regulator n=1 Tax=Sphingomonas sp. TaxID=28214 RepID=UPI002C122E60|nr:TetR/AcrR family transcriptional regulator [Sphingomonas sp.]HWK34749.1 TetR/AcrR family transcriptional regulator [Sphingomonas sp.]
MTERLPLRQRKAERTRNDIIRSAMTLFERQGYVETTLNQIADLAEIHKQTVLRYFATKEDIALALHLATLEQFRDALERPDRVVSVLESWREHVVKWSRRIGANPRQFQFGRSLALNDRIMGHMLLVERRYEAMLAEAFSREAGLDPETDLHSKLLAVMLVAGNFSVSSECYRRDDAGALESACTAVVDHAAAHFSR